MEALQNAVLMALAQETVSIYRQKQSLKRRSMLIARLREAVHLELVFDTLKAKAPSGRVHPPARKDDVWYAVNGNRMLVMREVDLDKKAVYALERMTKKQFEEERIHLPFRSAVKGATKL